MLKPVVKALHLPVFNYTITAEEYFHSFSLLPNCSNYLMKNTVALWKLYAVLSLMDKCGLCPCYTALPFIFIAATKCPQYNSASMSIFMQSVLWSFARQTCRSHLSIIHVSTSVSSLVIIHPLRKALSLFFYMILQNFKTKKNQTMSLFTWKKKERENRLLTFCQLQVCDL